MGGGTITEQQKSITTGSVPDTPANPWTLVLHRWFLEGKKSFLWTRIVKYYTMLLWLARGTKYQGESFPLHAEIEALLWQ